MKRLRIGILAIILSAALLIGGVMNGAFIRQAQAIDLGDILVIGGIVLVVSTFGDQINNFINNTLGQNQVASVGASKVVPIFSVGRGAYVGAAQVLGAPDNVRRVQGVGTVEATLGNLSGSLLVPISTRRPSGGTSLNRVAGVGVGAVIDFRL